MSTSQDEPEVACSDCIPKSLEQVQLKAKLPKIISFSDLARCGEEIWIENNGELYRLRRTRQGKLILTK